VVLLTAPFSVGRLRDCLRPTRWFRSGFVPDVLGRVVFAQTVVLVSLGSVDVVFTLTPSGGIIVRWQFATVAISIGRECIPFCRVLDVDGILSGHIAGFGVRRELGFLENTLVRISRRLAIERDIVRVEVIREFGQARSLFAGAVSVATPTLSMTLTPFISGGIIDRLAGFCRIP
jgi:hypothetical protein